MIAEGNYGQTEGVFLCLLSFARAKKVRRPPAATGNIPTDDLLYMFDRSGVETGVSLEKIIETSDWLAEQLGRGVPAMLPKAGIFPQIAEGIREAS